MSHEQRVEPPETPRRKQWMRVAGILAAAAGLILLGRKAGAYVPQFAEWVDGLGVWGPIVFVLGYAAATVAFVPGSLLTLAAGAIFGLAKGVIYVFIAAMLGSAAAFLVSRYFARQAIEQRVAANPRFAAIDRAVGDQGRKIVFLLRLSPVFPFNLLNYGLGLTRVGFGDYLLASIGMLPGTFLFVYYGKLAGDVAALAGGGSPEKGAGYYVVLSLGLAATVAVTAFVTRIARRALKEATGE
ncbi:MAG TPA: TVP38/TMEM64 family protein [Candidatus Acidoferrales bacterium]|nr:TVP38/TMEM64 family protein [Candidatus Acidoferrales bacterium]